MALTNEEIEKRIRDSYELPNNVLNIITKPLVSVRTSTYQHGPYIKDCIEGVLMQKTSFPFEFIIGEDFSTDGTREIVFKYAEKYPNVIRVITADYNVGMKANGTRCKRAIRGKYIAICEGDDFWTDPFKLQKQVDFLETNQDYGLIYTDVDKLIEGNNYLEKNIFKNNASSIKNTYEDFLLNAWFLAPCTWTFRADILSVIQVHFSENNIVSDLPLVLGISKFSKIAFLPDSTAVYRVLPSSASHFKTRKEKWKFRQGIYIIQMNFAEFYRESQLTITEIKTKYFLEYFGSICFFGDSQLKKEAYNLLKSRSLLKDKHKYLNLITQYSMIRRLLILIYK